MVHRNQTTTNDDSAGQDWLTDWLLSVIMVMIVISSVGRENVLLLLPFLGQFVVISGDPTGRAAAAAVVVFVAVAPNRTEHV